MILLVISCAAPFITLRFPEHEKTFNYFFNVLASRSEGGKSITLNNCSPHGVKWAKSCLSFITLLFDSLVVRVSPCYERDPKPISRMWSFNCLPSCHSIRFELQRVNVKPADEWNVFNSVIKLTALAAFGAPTSAPDSGNVSEKWCSPDLSPDSCRLLGVALHLEVDKLELYRMIRAQYQ